MTNATLTLTDFLLARVTEDEAAVDVRAGIRVDYWTDAEQDALERVGSTRVLAECEAKRRIVGWAEQYADDFASENERMQYGRTLAVLANVYSDHPDYRQEWKP